MPRLLGCCCGELFDEEGYELRIHDVPLPTARDSMSVASSAVDQQDLPPTEILSDADRNYFTPGGIPAAADHGICPPEGLSSAADEGTSTPRSLSSAADHEFCHPPGLSPATDEETSTLGGLSLASDPGTSTPRSLSSAADHEDSAPAERDHEKAWFVWDPPFVEAVNDMFELKSDGDMSWLQETDGFSLAFIKKTAESMFKDFLSDRVESFATQYTPDEVLSTILTMQSMKRSSYPTGIIQELYHGGTLKERREEEYERRTEEDEEGKQEVQEEEKNTNYSQEDLERWAEKWTRWTEVAGSTRGIRLTFESVVYTLENLDEQGWVNDQLFQSQPEGSSYDDVKKLVNGVLDTTLSGDMSADERRKIEVSMAMDYMKSLIDPEDSNPSETQPETSDQPLNAFLRAPNGQGTEAPTDTLNTSTVIDAIAPTDTLHTSTVTDVSAPES